MMKKYRLNLTNEDGVLVKQWSFGVVDEDEFKKSDWDSDPYFESGFDHFWTDREIMAVQGWGSFEDELMRTIKRDLGGYKK